LRKKPVIAIDGPVASGKSTCGKKIAQRLDFCYLDTGALYRAIGLKALQSEVGFDDHITIGKMLENTQVSLEPTANGQHTFLDGEDVSEAIRSQEVGSAASAISQLPEVRRFLLDIQREMGRQGGIVLDGRDIGTVVFPDAEIKFFLNANPQERARRRFKELREKGLVIEYAAVLKESGERDKADAFRTEAPLKITEDAIQIDSSGKNIEETVEEMIRFIQEKYPNLPVH
jgi:cytidylate kinase